MIEGFPIIWRNEGSVIILSYTGRDGDMKRQCDLHKTSHLTEGQASRVIHPPESILLNPSLVLYVSGHGALGM